ncbi:hypothetical protein [Klebsiella phage PhiKpNIH-10]|uniref:Uncharacterized protein n=1 Tax=Klebsiella phage PhiKpNIH-10 TaxID=2689113 RepID=A0A6B9LSD3_9CAUD|nr:hypothetical protein [Klebsiella phage PhiKpNIH-10]
MHARANNRNSAASVALYPNHQHGKRQEEWPCHDFQQQPNFAPSPGCRSHTHQPKPPRAASTAYTSTGAASGASPSFAAFT